LSELDFTGAKRVGEFITRKLTSRKLYTRWMTESIIAINILKVNYLYWRESNEKCNY